MVHTDFYVAIETTPKMPSVKAQQISGITPPTPVPRPPEGAALSPPERVLFSVVVLL